MNKAGHIYEGRFIICGSLIKSVIRDEVQNELVFVLACYSAALELPDIPKAFSFLFQWLKMQRKNYK